jgi:putative transposase
MYYYRKLTRAQQAEAVEYRRLYMRPPHSPPHLPFRGQRQYFITGACFEHKHHLGKSHERMTNFEADLLAACEQHTANIYAWCVLPNHYHALVRTADLGALTSELGLLHGRTAYNWNGEDKQRAGKSGATAGTGESGHTGTSGPR